MGETAVGQGCGDWLSSKWTWLACGIVVVLGALCFLAFVIVVICDLHNHTDLDTNGVSHYHGDCHHNSSTNGNAY